MSDTKHTPELIVGHAKVFPPILTVEELKKAIQNFPNPAAEIAALRAELERKDARIRELEIYINEHYTAAATAYIKELEAQAGSLILERDKWKAKAERRREALIKVIGHTGLPLRPTHDLLLGLINSIARITRAAIEED